MTDTHLSLGLMLLTAVHSLELFNYVSCIYIYIYIYIYNSVRMFPQTHTHTHTHTRTYVPMCVYVLALGGNQRTESRAVTFHCVRCRMSH